MTIPAKVQSILRDAVTLRELPEDALDTDRGLLDASGVRHSAKNRAELHFATEEYGEPDGENYRARLPHIGHPSIEPDDIVLDIGCGPKSFFEGMPGHHVFVDDLISAYVDELGASYDGLAINCRSELMPLADNSVDVIYSVNMLDHVDDLPETMYELHRVLRPTGTIVLQTYFNSHPLLLSEPGVVDRYAYDTLIEPYFEVEELRTHSVESPEISSYYTMGILTCLLRKRDVPLPPRDRGVLGSPQYVGAQSNITECLAAISREEVEVARSHIDALLGREHYEFHVLLLEAKLAVAEGRLQEVNQTLREARSHPRGRRNPYARIAIKELELERLDRAIEIQVLRTADARDGIDRRQARIDELDDAIVSRDKRTDELSNTVLQRDLRIAQLERAVAARGRNLSKHGVQIDVRNPKSFEERIAEADLQISELEGRIADA